MTVVERLDAREVRYARAGLGLAGGFTAGVLLAGEQLVAGAGIAVATLLATFVLPRLVPGPVTDERTEARERWASATAIRVTCSVYVAVVVAGSVAIASGAASVTPAALGAFFGVGAVVVVHLLALGYAHYAGKP